MLQGTLRSQSDNALWMLMC